MWPTTFCSTWATLAAPLAAITAWSTVPGCWSELSRSVYRRFGSLSPHKQYGRPACVPLLSPGASFRLRSERAALVPKRIYHDPQAADHDQDINGQLF
jgi:hypothetical protein